MFKFSKCLRLQNSAICKVMIIVRNYRVIKSKILFSGILKNAVV